MKTLATFFVTLLLLAGSAWAQSQTSLDQSAGSGATVTTFGVSAKAQAGSGDIWDEVVVNLDQGQVAYVLNVSALSKPSTVSSIDAYQALGREAVRQGMIRGYTAPGATAIVQTSDHCYVMQFSTGDGVSLTSASVTCGSIQ